MTFGPIAMPGVSLARHRESPFVFPYFDQKKTKSYTRKHGGDEAFVEGIRMHPAASRAYPPKQVVGPHTRPPD